MSEGYQYKKPYREVKARPKTPAEYEKILRDMGMPEELIDEKEKMRLQNPDLADILDEADAYSMIKKYAVRRALQGMMSIHGEHKQLAMIAHDIDKSKSVSEWEELIRQALQKYGGN